MTTDDRFRRILGKVVDAFEDVLDKIPSLAELVDVPLISKWTPMIDRGGAALQGRITGHPMMPDQTTVTSILLFIDLDQKIARTKSRWYRLGDRWDYKAEAALSVPYLELSGAELRHGSNAVEISEHQMNAMIAGLPKELLLECMYRDESELAARLERVVETWPHHRIIN
jgi:hypothetical protein